MNEDLQTEMVMIDPQELMRILKENEESSLEKAEKISEYLKNVSPTEMVAQLKHLIYRHIQIIGVTRQSELTLTERLLLETIEDLFNGSLNALKWIAIHNNEDYKSDFGDIMLVQEVGDIIFGKSTSDDKETEWVTENKEEKLKNNSILGILDDA